jgi:hypothetical protein
MKIKVSCSDLVLSRINRFGISIVHLIISVNVNSILKPSLTNLYFKLCIIGVTAVITYDRLIFV